MKRGLFVVAALLAATVTTPATAASRGVVYEVVRHPSASTEADVTVHRLGGGGESVSMYAHLVPRSGGGYEFQSMGATWDSGGGGWSRTKVELGRGHRFVAGGIRGRVKVTVAEKGWSVREIGSGFRVLSAPAQRRLNVAGTDVQRYGRVTVPGGAYGSVAWARVGCAPGSGEWSVGTEVEGERRSNSCGPLSPTTSELEQTVRGRRWTVEGEAYGLHEWDTWIAVLDYPKR